MSAPPPPSPWPPVRSSTMPRKRRWLIPTVLGVSIVLVALAVWGAVTVANWFVGITTIVAPDQPLVEGEPGSASAIRPISCEEDCFGDELIPVTISSDRAFAQLGLRLPTEPWGTHESTTASELALRDLAGWQEYNGAPDACFFAPTSAPYAASASSATDASTDAVHFTGTHQDDALRDMSDQSVRLFSDSAAAEQYMLDLRAAIDACPAVEIGPEGERYSAEVRPLAGLSLPEQVTAVGWVREGDPGVRWRAYVFDLQYANAVVRTRLLTDGNITEASFRAFVEDVADEIAGRAPLLSR